MLLGSPAHAGSCQNPTVTNRPDELPVPLGVVGVAPVADPVPPHAAVIYSGTPNNHGANAALDSLPIVRRPFTTSPRDSYCSRMKTWKPIDRHVPCCVVRLTLSVSGGAQRRQLHAKLGVSHSGPGDHFLSSVRRSS